ncbi:hypothetical protein AOA80_00690 [Methanomassiliicoccales archaeon RumEn M1]|jgi:hypothetical protein|nr:hypothetical protein AOA80_00690 [Methanomassiliicoccales archaeon RumEn M1]
MTEPEQTDTSEMSEEEYEALRARKIKADAEKMAEAMFSKEARDHLVRAGTELVLAIDAMMPRDLVPPEVREHYLGAKRETLLLIRSILDAQLGMVEDLGKPVEKREDEVEPGLRKIDLE